MLTQNHCVFIGSQYFFKSSAPPFPSVLKEVIWLIVTKRNESIKLMVGGGKERTKHEPLSPLYVLIIAPCR